MGYGLLVVIPLVCSKVNPTATLEENVDMNVLIFSVRISRHLKVNYFVYHCQNFTELNQEHIDKTLVIEAHVVVFHDKEMYQHF